jgi:hypothetical protein
LIRTVPPLCGGWAVREAGPYITFPYSEVIEMSLGYFFLFLVGALMPGFFLFNFFKDAYDEYKHTGVFSLETLIGSPLLFFLSLACFVILLGLAIFFLFAAL